MAEDKIPTGSLPPEQDKEPIEPVEEELLLGKFKSAEDLAEAYQNLESKFGETSSKVGDLTKQNESLQNSFNELVSGQQKNNEPPPQDNTPALDIDAELKSIEAEYGEGNITFGEAMKRTSDLTAQITHQQTKAEVEQVRQDLTNLFQSTLSERDQKVQLDKFYDDHPDYKEFEESEDRVKLLNNNPLHDDLSAYYEWKMMRVKDEIVAEQQKIREGSEPSKNVVTKPGHSVQQTTKQRTSDPAEIRKRMEEAYDNAS